MLGNHVGKILNLNSLLGKLFLYHEIASIVVLIFFVFISLLAI